MVSMKTLRSLTEPLSNQIWITACPPDYTSSSGLWVVWRTARLCTTNTTRNKTPTPAPAVGGSGAGFFVAGFVVLWCVLCMAKLELPWWAAKIALCFIGFWFFTPELWDAPWTVKLAFAGLAGTLIHFFPNLLKRYFWDHWGI